MRRLEGLVEENQMIAVCTIECRVMTVMLMATLQKLRRQAVSSIYLCAMSDGNVLGAMPAELIWELERWIGVVYGRK